MGKQIHHISYEFQHSNKFLFYSNDCYSKSTLYLLQLRSKWICIHEPFRQIGSLLVIISYPDFTFLYIKFTYSQKTQDKEVI